MFDVTDKIAEEC